MKQKDTNRKIEKIHNYYDSRILQAKTIRECEEILRELVKDEDIPTTAYWNVYWSLEARARQIKKNQRAILAEAEAAIRTLERYNVGRQ